MADSACSAHFMPRPSLPYSLYYFVPVIEEFLHTPLLTGRPLTPPRRQFKIQHFVLIANILGWEFKEGTLQAKGGLFPWHDESLRELFGRLCEEGVDRAQELFENWQTE